MPALIVDPQLQASVIRQFNLKGELAPFNLTENVVPIFDIGALVRTVDPTVVTTLAGSQGVRVGTNGTGLLTRPVSFGDTQIDNSGPVVNPAAGTVLADTGALGAGAQQVHWTINNNAAAVSDFAVEWRDAAEAVTLAIWTFFVGGNAPSMHMFNPLMLQFVASERLRIVATSVVVGTVNATVGAVILNAASAL